jgi:hypothetical protein
MHTLSSRSLALTAVTLAFAATAFAAQASKPPSSAQSPSKTPTVSASQSKAKAKASLSNHEAVGTIEKYDANMLTLKTSSGDEQFALASSAKVHNGSKIIKADELGSLTGQRAKVHYTEANGQRTAESVMVSSSAHKAAAKGKTTP